MPSWCRAVVPTLSLMLLAGCSVFHRVRVEPLATAAQRPSNVGAYVAVRDGDEPLTELLPSNFLVYENDQFIPAEQTQLTLLDRQAVAAHHAVLLVDMSQARDQATRTLAAKATLGFVQKLSTVQNVSVFAFDGAPGLVAIGTVARGAPAPSMAALEAYSPRDSSRNLNGAVVAGLDKLDALLAQSGKPIRVGTLIVFTTGADAAGRVDGDETHERVWSSSYDVMGIAIGLGAETDQLESLARNGMVRAQASSTLPIAFEEAADKARAEFEKHYLVSYCSPARAGQRRLRLEVKYTTKTGEERTGDFEFDFNAAGFGPGCNSAVTPRFTFQPKAASGNAPNGGGSKSTPSQPSPHEGKAASPESDSRDDAPVPPPDQSGYAK